MSGCCGQGPVIVSGAAATPRVDVETLLLCDVLPDGTVAGLALVEPVYDTSSGERVGTRIVDPVTGAVYTPAGTLGLCSSPDDGCARQITVSSLCDDTDGDGVGDTPFVQVWSLDPCGDGAPELVGMYRPDDFTVSYTPVSPADCPAGEQPDAPLVLGTVCYGDGAGGTGTAAVVRCAGCEDPAVRYVDIASGAEVTAPAVVPCPAAPDRSTQLLCDVAADGTSVPFLRTFTATDTGTTAADTLLDGTTAYTPAGTVGVCLPVNDCASPTTPTATVGLCLPDGTPIAVTVIRDCAGVVTSEGWLNLRTGVFSAGAPPAGTVACGDSQSVQVSGTFCDVEEASGDVLGLVLIEYSYAADGAIASVRLVDATTGATYTPTGTITTCPAGVEQPEQDVVQLCDTAADGTVTPFVRDYRRDELGAITGHSDYLLDGTAYVPAGTVGTCEPGPQPERDLLQLCDVQADGTATVFLRDYERDEEGTVTGHADYALDGTPYAPTGTVGTCPDECLSCETQTLCDSEAAPVTASVTGTDTDVSAAAAALGVGHRPLPGGGAALWSGGVLDFPAEASAPADGGDPTQVYRGVGAVLAAEAPDCFTGDTVSLSASVRIARTSGTPFGYTGQLRLRNGTTTVHEIILGAGSQGTYTVSGDVPKADLDAGLVTFELWLETFQTTGKSWTADQFTATAEFAGCPATFQRTTCRDCAGEVVSVTDTLLTGEPYTLLGEPVLCSTPVDSEPVPEPCAKAVVKRCACDDNNGDGVADVQYAELWAVDPCGGAAPELLGTYRDGDLTQPYAPVNPVECTAAESLPGPLSTGVRAVTGTAVQDIAGAFPGLQSVTLTVLEGVVNVSMSDGTGVPIPAGVTMTWSVVKDEDTALTVASFTGATAAAGYLLNWTHR